MLLHSPRVLDEKLRAMYQCRRILNDLVFPTSCFIHGGILRGIYSVWMMEHSANKHG